MRKCLFILSIFLIVFCNSVWAHSANLLEVFQQALLCDQAYQQAIFKRLSDKEGVPISLAALLPRLDSITQPYSSKSISSGTNAYFTGGQVIRGYTFNLTLRQTIFDFAKVANLTGQRAFSKQADANINAALQDLMIRVSRAYFAILQDEDNVRYNIANKESYAKQLEQVQEQYKVGLKTLTDVYTAKAAYESSKASYTTALNQLADDKENLRVITGVYYPNLAKLSERFPIIPPTPNNMESWVNIARCQNWEIMAARYAANVARQAIKQQFAGHLPTLEGQGNYQINYQRTITPPQNTDLPIFIPGLSFNGSSKLSTITGSVILNIPISQGGAVIANTRRAQFNYRVAMNQLELKVRTTVNNARQSFLGILSNISRMKSDKEAILSSKSSLEGLEAAYQVGTGTLVDVLNVQRLLFQNQTQYASDRYGYVNDLLNLKNAAGTLSCEDLRVINSWLYDESEEVYMTPSKKDINL